MSLTEHTDAPGFVEPAHPDVRVPLAEMLQWRERVAAVVADLEPRVPGIEQHLTTLRALTDRFDHHVDATAWEMNR